MVISLQRPTITVLFIFNNPGKESAVLLLQCMLQATTRKYKQPLHSHFKIDCHWLAKKYLRLNYLSIYNLLS